MPAGAAKIWPKINSGKNQTHLVPQVSAQRDAIGRSAIHTVSLESSGERRSPVTERTRRSNSMAHRGLLDIGSNNPHIAEARGDFSEAGNAGTVDAVVIADEDTRSHFLNETRPGVFAAECY